LGTSAKEAIPRLQPMLASGKPFERVQVAKAMRLVNATPDLYVPTLIEILAEDSHYAAMELGQLGDPAVPALQGALRDANATRRQNAAYAIGNMAGWGYLTKDRESVAELLITLTHDENSEVVYHTAQALGSVRAIPERSVPALVSLLRHNDGLVARAAVQSLGEFGAQAAPARAALIELLPNHDPNLIVDYAIRQIGIDRARNRRADFDEWSGNLAFHPVVRISGAGGRFPGAEPTHCGRSF
jgi:HEAT repeat protein